MNITELRYLVAIMKWGSVSAAAKQMYGCEELPAGQPVLCDVVLEGTDGACCTLPYPDKELTRLGIDEGSRVHLLPDGTLQKISEELL